MTLPRVLAVAAVLALALSVLWPDPDPVAPPSALPTPPEIPEEIVDPVPNRPAAQLRQLSGTVRNAEDGTPIEGARITVTAYRAEGNSMTPYEVGTAASGTDGRFELPVSGHLLSADFEAAGFTGDRLDLSPIGEEMEVIGIRPTMKKVVSDRRASLDEDTEVRGGAMFYTERIPLGDIDYLKVWE